jgi:nitrogen fixation-related uncharacterized protein
VTNKFLIVIIFFFTCFFLSAQNEDEKVIEEAKKVLVVSDSTVFIKKEYDALSPSKAAFYSAVLPGLGQAYNKKYWKIPIVYAAIGTGIYFYVTNNNQYNDVRDAYKRRLAGFTDDEFQGLLTDDGLLEAQKTLRRNKELSLLITFGLYALNIIDANVDAHLMQFNVNDDLSFKPHYKIEEFDNKGRVGLTLNYQF